MVPDAILIGIVALDHNSIKESEQPLLDDEGYSACDTGVMLADAKRYHSALEYATKMHADQKRIGGDDYISHPIAVAELLRTQQLPIEYQIAALFHDLLEDTPASMEDIIQLGGTDVGCAVQLLTKEPGYIMADYIARIKANPIVKAVKAADRYHNLKCAVAADDAFKKKYIRETLEWYMDFSAPAVNIEQAVSELEQTL